MENKVILKTFYGFHVSLDSNNYIEYTNQHCGDGLLYNGNIKYKQLHIPIDKKKLYIDMPAKPLTLRGHESPAAWALWSAHRNPTYEENWNFKTNIDEIHLELDDDLSNIIGLKVQRKEHHTIPKFKVKVSYKSKTSDYIESRSNNDTIFSGEPKIHHFGDLEKRI